MFVFGYCEGTKAYRLLCLQTKRIIKNKNAIFMEEGMSVGNALEMRPSGRNQGTTVVLIDKYFKSSLCDDDKEWK